MKEFEKLILEHLRKIVVPNDLPVMIPDLNFLCSNFVVVFSLHPFRVTIIHENNEFQNFDDCYDVQHVENLCIVNWYLNGILNDHIIINLSI